MTFVRISISALLTCAAATGLSATATAQQGGHYGYGYQSGYQTNGYNHSQNCETVRRGQGTGGALIGGVLGGLAGLGLAGNEGVEDEGAALGALVGAVAGSEFAKSRTKCSPSVYGPNGQISGRQSVYSASDLRGGQHEQYGQYGYNDYADEGYYDRHSDYREDSYYGRERPAAKECETVMQVTKFPDGREMHEPVTVCREAFYGDWNLRNNR